MAVGCAPDTGDEEYAAACSAALDCFIPCRGYAECTECLELQGPETVGLTAAYDTVQCAYELCPIVCGPGADVETCLRCAEQLCPAPMAACDGWGSNAYDAGQGEPLITCFELRACVADCNSEIEACGPSCYWGARPLARLAFWKLWALVHGTCADCCQDAPSPGCEACIEAHAGARGITDCLAPG